VPARSSGVPQSAGEFSFAVLNDLHHAGPECDPWFEGLASAVAARRPQFALLLGDLAHRGAPESFAALERIWRAAGVAVFPVPGNHDNDVAGDPRHYAEVFPARRNYRFGHAGWQFVGLDTTDGTVWEEATIAAETLAWFEAQVDRWDSAAPTIVFTHFPLAPGIANEHGALMTPRNAPELLARIAAQSNVRAVLSGHFHGNTERRHGGLLLATGACCSRVDHAHDGSSTKGWWWCTASADGGLRREFVALAS
jgi:3',5'-cyclic AMP phosphodiesterase CpdA